MSKGIHFRGWLLAAAVILFIGGHGASAWAQDSEALKAKILAKGFLLYDPQAQKVVLSRDADGPYAPASTTKLMTALMVMERNGLGGSVTVMERDTWVEPSHVPLVAGETVSIKNLVSALLIGSDNDCAMTLGRKVGGDLPTFITMMNQRAKSLGCRRTNFVNPNGLPAAGQYTTCNDLLLIFQKVIAIPELRRICETLYFDLRTETGAQRIKNHNKLLGVYPGMGPAKTGWTVSSQHTYAASCTRNGRELQLIILKSPNKWNDARLLFDYGFAHLSPVKRGREDAMLGKSNGTAAPVPLTGPVPQPVPVMAPVSKPAPVIQTVPVVQTVRPMPVVQTIPDTPAPVQEAAKEESSDVANADEVISYVVKKGDTLSSISRRFSSSVELIQQSNPDVDPHRLVPGMILHIPKSANGEA